MRRDPALVRLSRDHHQALVVAQDLRRATQGTLNTAIESFRMYWERDGAEHFAAEEQILLPLLAEQARQGESVVTDVLIDHLVLRDQADRVLGRPSGSDRLEDARALGTSLTEHVRREDVRRSATLHRREERVLFPLLERVLSADQLTDLADRLEHTRLRYLSRSDYAADQEMAERWSGLNYGPFPGPGDSEGG